MCWVAWFDLKLKSALTHTPVSYNNCVYIRCTVHAYCSVCSGQHYGSVDLPLLSCRSGVARDAVVFLLVVAEGGLDSRPLTALSLTTSCTITSSSCRNQSIDIGYKKQRFEEKRSQKGYCMYSMCMYAIAIIPACVSRLAMRREEEDGSWSVCCRRLSSHEPHSQGVCAHVAPAPSPHSTTHAHHTQSAAIEPMSN